MTPFLTLGGFTDLFDGPPLTASQQNIVTLLLNVASQWIYNNGPQGANLPSDDPTAQFVVFDVVSTAVRFQKYSKLKNYNRMTAHRAEGGSFDDPMRALEFTDTHKQLLQIPLRAIPLTSCRPNDFMADDFNQGWETPWSASFGDQGWDYWQVNND
jgi:hypothetical protein